MEIKQRETCCFRAGSRQTCFQQLWGVPWGFGVFEGQLRCPTLGSKAALGVSVSSKGSFAAQPLVAKLPLNPEQSRLGLRPKTLTARDCLNSHVGPPLRGGTGEARVFRGSSAPPRSEASLLIPPKPLGQISSPLGSFAPVSPDSKRLAVTPPSGGGLY